MAKKPRNSATIRQNCCAHLKTVGRSSSHCYSSVGTSENGIAGNKDSESVIISFGSFCYSEDNCWGLPTGTSQLGSTDKISKSQVGGEFDAKCLQPL